MILMFLLFETYYFLFTLKVQSQVVPFVNIIEECVHGKTNLTPNCKLKAAHYQPRNDLHGGCWTVSPLYVLYKCLPQSPSFCIVLHLDVQGCSVGICSKMSLTIHSYNIVGSPTTCRRRLVTVLMPTRVIK